MESQQTDDRAVPSNRTHVPANTSQSIDWYHEGEERIVGASGLLKLPRHVHLVRVERRRARPRPRKDRALPCRLGLLRSGGT